MKAWLGRVTSRIPGSTAPCPLVCITRGVGRGLRRSVAVNNDPDEKGEIHEMMGRRGGVIDTGKLNDHAIDLQLRRKHRERRRQRGKREEQISWSEGG